MKTIKVTVFGIGFALLMGCGSEPKYLYPTDLQRQVQYLCTLIYEKQYSSNKQWNQSLPGIIKVTPGFVTVFFENQESYSIPNDSSYRVPVGAYRCRN